MPDDGRTGSAEDLAALWSQTAPRYRSSRDAIELCKAWGRGQKKPHLPPKWQAPESFSVQLPYPLTMPLDVAAYVSRRWPAPKRAPLGGTASVTANRKANAVEEWLDAVLTDKISVEGSPLWSACVSSGTADGEYAVLVQPCLSHYAGMLDLTDDDGSIRANWRRDSKGESEDDYKARGAKGFRVSKRKSTEAYTAYTKDYQASRFPMLVRLLSPLEYLPFGRDPETGRLSALLIRTQRTLLDLKADGFSFFAHGESGAVGDMPTNTPGTEYLLYELWSYDPEQGVRVAYQVEGIEGTKYETRRGKDQAVLNLTEEYGFTKLHAGVFYGWERSHEKDPNWRGIPLLYPFLGIMSGAQQVITAEVAHAYLTGFGTWGHKPDPALLGVWTEQGRPMSINMQPMEMVTIFGDVVPLVHPGSGEPDKVIQLLLGLIERFDLSKDVKGNADQSGFSQAVSASAVDTILASISRGAVSAVKFVSECLLEQAACLSKKLEAPIPVYVHTNQDGETKRHVELSADDLDGDFTIDIIQPTKKGQNLALAQSGEQWRKDGAISHYTWLEDMYGDEQPEKEIDRIAIEQYMKTEEVQKQVFSLLEVIQGNKAAQEIRKLQEQGAVSQGQHAAEMLPPRPGMPGLPPGVGGEMVQSGVPQPNTGSPAIAAANGMQAGPSMTAPQANVIAATGAPAEVSMPA